MANPEHLSILKSGVGEWNNWRFKNPFVSPDLESVDLRGISLSGVDFGSHVCLEGFSMCSLGEMTDAMANGCAVNNITLEWGGVVLLKDADLRNSILDNAQLAGARLSGARLDGANLGNANLRHSRLEGTVLNSALLDKTLFGRATMESSSLGDLDLRQALELDSVTHYGPSTIGLDTIVKSKGQIPSRFLRGVGVPDNFITFAKSLITAPIEFHSCFISFSTKDQEFADRLYADLQNSGVRCWFAPHDIEGGKKIHEQIDEAIRAHDRLLLIVSQHSMKSSWVETEISKARKREQRECRRMLFPLLLVDFNTVQDWECFDADTGKDSAREIREYFIPDFSDWKSHDSYKAAFDRLLRDLKSKSEAAGKSA
jgi:uncharacterized protein YjbI with pentapeptide repeats